MSAYLDADIGGGKMQLSGPVTVRGRPTMLAWFEDVQVKKKMIDLIMHVVQPCRL